ncbi:hypothetical protein POM88_031805 [Heracleum sosnowskyi]|uniref:MULE transposase domain-containing protein n=1 Tax=Heracleum sosnowskyi TaxID=360622 RepID=A0AAD8I035_9APIA|nr:hypothetical protein POM88_031805 [Heracleum sosnowskyi]
MINEDLLRISSNQGVTSFDSSHASRFIDDALSDCEAGLNFYKDYGRSCGFGTRRSVEKQDEDHTVISKCVVCNRSRFNEKKQTISDGATMRDFRNFRRDLKEYVGEPNAHMIIEKFNAKKESCESFYFAYELDKEEHLTKLFWADSVARRNYELYGDAVWFDATFDTNKYNMVFCPFTGIDKHEKCVTFGFALLSKEDIPHFKWAFDQFLKAMGRNPVCIITDQCPEMKQAIPMSFHATEEFPATKHRLSTQVYTRPVFYKVQQEMVASGYDMRIQTIGPLVDGIKCYEMKDVMLKDQIFKLSSWKHAFCVLTHYEGTKLPRNLVLNRWNKNSENAPSSIKLLGVSDDFKRMDNASLKQTNIWFSFQKSMNKAGVNLEKLAYVEKTVKQLVSDLGDDTYLSKKAHIEMLMGPHPREDLTIHVPK